MPTESDRFVPRSGARADAAGLCAGCAYAADFLAHGQCQPGDICIRAHSGRQIDRFLRRNPQEASKFLDDLFWERRAIAARHAPAEEVYRLRYDVDEVVRRVVVTRLPEALLATMLSDPDREVRLSVATRLPAELLPRMTRDPDYLIRATVARRLPHGQLVALARDPEREVRKIVAARLPSFALSRLADDREPEVRAIVAERALPELAALMIRDEEWWVRLAAVATVPPECLPAIAADDPEAEVRNAARERMDNLTRSSARESES